MNANSPLCECVFGFDDYSPQTLSEVAKVFNISRERVRQNRTSCVTKTAAAQRDQQPSRFP
ncbi:sigma factor-like helix-turn-helix DNA-binding protein [Novipirellula maiorica]|uniref:sigma factor-like helix-turn-helix DNA-binding protein n=1 Tax=Novipirellula maiorica TaxID=1265734 RepID=UPI0009DB1AEF